LNSNKLKETIRFCLLVAAMGALCHLSTQLRVNQSGQDNDDDQSWLDYFGIDLN